MGIFDEFKTLIGTNLYVMRKIKEMGADQIYLISGASTANSAFFERESDCKLFLELADKYLSDFMDINGFQNNKDGWAMIITTKSAEAIMASYQTRRSRSNKCKEGCAYKEIWSPAVPRDPIKYEYYSVPM